jgi:hypothetical protein
VTYDVTAALICPEIVIVNCPKVDGINVRKSREGIGGNLWI